MTKICKNIQCRPDTEVYNPNKDFERLGAARFSVSSSFGTFEMLNELQQEYTEYFATKTNEGKNIIV